MKQYVASNKDEPIDYEELGYEESMNSLNYRYKWILSKWTIECRQKGIKKRE